MHNQAQAANIARFAKKLPTNARNRVSVHPLPNGCLAVQAVSAGKVPRSRAVYEKQIDAEGYTLQYTKTTYDQFGHIISVKDKISGGTI